VGEKRRARRIGGLDCLGTGLGAVGVWGNRGGWERAGGLVVPVGIGAREVEGCRSWWVGVWKGVVVDELER
jgi:hypothetical protein